MKKYLLLILFLIPAILLVSCYEELIDAPIGNKTPKTFISIFPDSSISQQQSSVRLHWWGDDPDGVIVGFFITFDDVNWKLTTKNDSLISFPIQGNDTSYNFRVAAIDNDGNGLYDNNLIYNGKSYGPELFTDKNNNGIRDPLEPFIDCGAIDPNPATLKLPLKNSPPVVSFLVDKNNSTILIPDTTFPVASFGWTISDLDGDATVTKVIIALNDTANKIELPGNTRFVTLKVEPPYSSDLTECDLYLGTSINNPYHTKLPGLRLNSENRIYIFAEDIAGGKSSLIAMPSLSNNTGWYVKKPVGDILLIDDNATVDNSAQFYNVMLDSLNLNRRYDIWDIKLGKTPTIPAKLLPKFISPQFTETLKLFKVVIWYTDTDPSLEAAQISVRNYVINGGKVLFSMLFPQSFDSRGLSDFLPLDSISYRTVGGSNGILFSNTRIIPFDTGLYDSLITSSQMARIRAYYPNTVTATNIYRLDYADNFFNNPVVGFKTTDSKIIYMGIPLHVANGIPVNLYNFFQQVLFNEFGVTQ